MAFEEKETPEFEENVVFVNRCAKVVKGGRRFSFSAVVVIGNRAGKVGLGFGKGTEAAKRSLVTIKMKGTTIPHEVTGQCDGGRVLLKPACDGTGVIAGGGMRAVLELSGIHNILGKSQGSKNRLNVVKATFDALSQLRTAEEIKAQRNA